MAASIREYRLFTLSILVCLLLGTVLGVSSNNFMLLGLVVATGLFVVLFVACLANIEVWLVAYALAISLLPQVSVAGMPVQFGDMLFLIGVMIFISRLRYVKSSVLLAAAFLFVVTVIISVLGVFRYNAGLAFTSFLNAGRIIEVVFPVFLLSTYDKIDYLKITKYFLIFSVLSCLLGIIQFIAQYQVDPKTVWIGSKKFYRAAGIFKESNSFGHFTACVSVVLSVLLFERKKLQAVKAANVWLIPLALIICLLACLLTFSRGALVVYLIGIIFYALLTKRGTIIAKLAVTVSFPLIGMWLLNKQVFQLLSERITMTVTNMFTDFDSISGGRVDSWAMAADVIKQNLLVGIGYKNTVEYFVYYYGDSRAGDNNYITILMELGITGFVAFAFLALTLIFWLHRKKEGVSQTAQYVMLSVWMATLIQMLVLDSFTFWRSLTMLFIFSGILLSYKSKKKEVVV